MGDVLWGWCCWGINEIHLWMIPCGEFQPWCWFFSLFYVGLWCALRWRFTFLRFGRWQWKFSFYSSPHFCHVFFFVWFPCMVLFFGCMGTGLLNRGRWRDGRDHVGLQFRFNGKWYSTERATTFIELANWVLDFFSMFLGFIFRRISLDIA